MTTATLKSGHGLPIDAHCPVEVLCRIVGDGVDIHRCAAARTLGRIGEARAVPTLTRALLDEDEDVRADAAAALAAIGAPESGDQLLENLLGDPVGEVKLAAIDALVVMRHPAIIPWLRRLAEGRDDEVAWEEDGSGDWDDWVDIQVKAIQGLAELGDEGAAEVISNVLGDEFGQDLSEIGFKALARLGGPGVAALSRFLGAPSIRLRRRAATALAAVAGGPPNDIVRRALGDPDPEVRLAMAMGIAEHDPSDTRLVPLLTDGEASVRCWAATQVGLYDEEGARALLDDPSDLVRLAGLDAIAGASRDRAAALFDTLVDTINDPVEMVVAAAIRVLVHVDTPDALDLIVEIAGDDARPETVRVAALDALSGAGAALEPLLSAMSNDSRPLRLQAISSLAKRAAAGGADSDEAMALLLASARGELAEPTPAPSREPQPAPVTERIDDPQDATPEEPVPTSTLAAILADGSTRTAALIEKTKGVELTPGDVEMLARAGSTPKKQRVSVIPDVALADDLRRLGARLLGDLAREEVADTLAALLDETDGELRRIAADSLVRVAIGMGGLGETARASLRKVAADSDAGLRLAVVRALGHSGDPQMARVLKPRLRDEDVFVRKEAVLALGRLGRVDRVRPMLEDDSPMVRMAAAQALVANLGSAADFLVELVPTHEGLHAREIGRLLRPVARPMANSWLIDQLGDEGRRDVWAAVIDALEALNRTDLAVDGGSDRPQVVTEQRRVA